MTSCTRSMGAWLSASCRNSLSLRPYIETHFPRSCRIPTFRGSNLIPNNMIPNAQVYPAFILCFEMRLCDISGGEILACCSLISLRERTTPRMLCDISGGLKSSQFLILGSRDHQLSSKGENTSRSGVFKFCDQNSCFFELPPASLC